MDSPFGFGGIKSPYDNRDINLGKLASEVPVSLPDSWENGIMHSWLIWHQRKIGACVGHSLAKNLQYYWFRKTGKVVNFSPRFIYAIAKTMDGIADEGTYPRLIAKILTDYGCATEDTCPNDTILDHETYVYNRKIANIPQAALDEAKKYKISGYAFVPLDEYSIKKAIMDHGCVSLLVRVGSEWWLPSWDKKDIVPLRVPNPVLSGHEIVLTGWTIDGNKTVLNSWSNAWADQGFNKLPWLKYKPWLDEAIVLIDLDPKIIEDAKNTKFLFTRDLKYGETSPDVKQLQIRLGMQEKYQTGYFGFITLTTVVGFQIYNRIFPINGIIHSGIRNFLNS